MANKKVLGAVGTGILLLVTGWVTGAPQWVETTFFPAPPLTVSGSTSPDRFSADRCSVEGSYVVPSADTPSGTSITLAALTSLLTAHGGQANETAGTYVLQGAAAGTTVVITAVHTVVVARTPARANRQVDLHVGFVNTACGGGGPTTAAVSVDLDSDSPRPVITGGDGGNGAPHTVNSIEVAVGNDSPLILDIDARTTKYDITWKLRVDYTINGHPGTAWLQDQDQPFHTVATVGEPVITLTGSDSSPVLAVAAR